MLTRVAAGERLDDAVVHQVRALLSTGDAALARTVGESLLRRPGTFELGSLLLAITAFDGGYRELAWKHFAQVNRDAWSRWAVREFVLAGTSVASATVIEQLRALVDETAADVTPEGWGDAAGHAFGIKEGELASALFARFDAAVDAADPSDLDPRVKQSRDWFRRWIDLKPDSRSAPALPEGHVSFGVMDYDHPGRLRASANIGDHVQSIASLGHLVRHTGATFHGDADLAGLLTRLAGRVRDDLRIEGPPADVDVITVDRDASAYDAIPPKTWTLAFGWFMHPVFEVSYGLPPHRNLLPLYVSFHCNKRDLLTPEVVDHLREFGPIGCRDWTTTDLLLSMDVPAFFSGCLTTTTSTVFPPLEERPGPRAPVAAIDVPDEIVPTGATQYAHSDDSVRFRSFSENVDRALELLETYRSTHSAVITSRLHAYLPCRSLGLDVDFRPANRSDVRFEGLGGISDQQFDDIRTGLLDLLSPIVEAILTGEEQDAVYAMWRKNTASLVEAAERRHTAPSSIPRFPLDRDAIQEAVDDTRLVERSGGPKEDAVEVVVHVGRQGQDALAQGLEPLVRSLARTASRPLTVTLLTRAPDRVDIDHWSKRFPDVTFRFIATNGLAADLRTPLGKAPRARDLDVVLLPELLPEVDRVVLLPHDSVATSDVAELFDLDLHGATFGAPDTVGIYGSSGFGILHVGAQNLRDHTKAAAELRRFAHSRHVYDFDGCTSSVLVLDLAAMRDNGFVADQLDRIQAFGLSLTALLCLEAGPDRAVVPETWDAAPTRSAIDEPKLIHWADVPKPWASPFVPAHDVWQEMRER